MRSALAGNFRKLLRPGLRRARVFCVPKPGILAPVAVNNGREYGVSKRMSPPKKVGQTIVLAKISTGPPKKVGEIIVPLFRSPL